MTDDELLKLFVRYLSAGNTDINKFLLLYGVSNSQQRIMLESIASSFTSSPKIIINEGKNKEEYVEKH